jgi:hypothetical protein
MRLLREDGKQMADSFLSRRRLLITAAASVAATPVRAQSLAAREKFSPTAPMPIEVDAQPVPFFDRLDHAHVRFGSLEYRSGLVLTSKFSGFGGLSGLRLDPKGERFISFSDKGTWFTGRIVYLGRQMTGLADVEAAPMLGPDGTSIAAHGWYDTESIARDGDLVYIGIEGVNQVLRFDFGRDGVRAHGKPIALPPAVRVLPRTKGLKSLVFVPKGLPLAGTLVAISERGLDPHRNIVGFLIGGPQPGQFSVRRTDDFDISDAVLLPAGDLLVLERKASARSGVGIRIRRLALKSIAPGALVDGPSIFDADLGQEIDNFEGIDGHVAADGDTVLTMVSQRNWVRLAKTGCFQSMIVYYHSAYFLTNSHGPPCRAAPQLRIHIDRASTGSARRMTSAVCSDPWWSPPTMVEQIRLLRRYGPSIGLWTK